MRWPKILSSFIEHRLTASKVFCFFFLFVIFAGLILQKIIIPATPWHAGNGLLAGGDWEEFHRYASQLASSIEESGWGNWRLGHAENGLVGIVAFIYALTGIHAPWILLPLTGGLYGLAAVVLFDIFIFLSGDRRVGALAVVPLLIFPSTAMIWGQVHKDVWMVPGSFLILLSFLRLGDLKGNISESVSLMFCNYLGFSLVWIVRPYANKVFSFAGLIAFSIGFLLRFCEKKNKGRYAITALGLLLVYMLPFVFLSKLGSSKWGKEIEGKTGLEYCNVWKQTPPIPLVDNQIRGLVCSREEFKRKYPDAGSNLDSPIKLTNLEEIIRYLPRAAQIGLFSPFPNMWLNKGHKPGGALMRLISGVEMCTFYFLLIGLFFIPWKSEKRILIVSGLIFCFVVILSYSIAVINIGTLYRMRYPMMLVLMGFGSWGWLNLIKKGLFLPRTLCHNKRFV